MSSLLTSKFLEPLRNPSITNEAPTTFEQRRTDLVMIAVILVAVILGWSVRNGAVNSVKSYAFNGGIPTITIPSSWIESKGDGLLLRAVDPASTSTFNAYVQVFARPLREGEDLNQINVSWPLKRSGELERFRTLDSRAVVGPDNVPAVLITYAYLADPTRESGTLGMPVVVRGQDLLFTVAEGNRTLLVVVSTAADASEWEREVGAFHAIHERLGVEY